MALLQRPNLVVHSYTWMDPKQNRSVIVRVTYPKLGKDLPIVVFSHGARSSESAMDPLVNYWAQNGYVVFQPRHEDAFGNPPPAQKPNNAKFWRTRLADCQFVYAIARHVKSWVPELDGRLNTKAIIQAGHVHGANTSQTLGGMKRTRRSYASPIPIAFCCISPPGIAPDIDEQSWTDFKRPLLVVSGTEDALPIDTSKPGFTPESHQNPFRLSPPGDKFLLWIQGATTNFGGITGDSSLPPPAKPDARQVRWVQETTLAFFDAFAKRDGKQQHWLKSHDLAAETKGEAVISWR